MSFILKAAEAGLSRAHDQLSGFGVLDSIVSAAVKVQENINLARPNGAGTGAAVAKGGVPGNGGLMGAIPGMMAGLALAGDAAQSLVADVVVPAAGAGLTTVKGKLAEVDIHQMWMDTKQKVRHSAQYWINHPNKAAAIVAGGVALVAFPGMVTVPILHYVGFGSGVSGGVLGGSFAAGFQSGIGNVAAGSLYALGQSAGAGGLGLAAVNMVVQVPGAAVVVCGATGMCTTNNKDTKDQKEYVKTGKCGESVWRTLVKWSGLGI